MQSAKIQKISEPTKFTFAFCGILLLFFEANRSVFLRKSLKKNYLRPTDSPCNSPE